MSSTAISLRISSSDASVSCRRTDLNKSGCSNIKLCLMYVNLEAVSTANLNNEIDLKNKILTYRLHTLVWMAPRIDQFRSVAALVIGMIWSILKTVARVVFGKHPAQNVFASTSPLSKAAQLQCSLRANHQILGA